MSLAGWLAGPLQCKRQGWTPRVCKKHRRIPCTQTPSRHEAVLFYILTAGHPNRFNRFLRRSSSRPSATDAGLPGHVPGVRRCVGNEWMLHRTGWDGVLAQRRMSARWACVAPRGGLIHTRIHTRAKDPTAPELFCPLWPTRGP